MRVRAIHTLIALAAAVFLAPLPAAVAGDTAEVVVAIDAGHGGIDPGASAGGLVEKEVALAVARRFAAHLDATEGLRGALIRDDDSFLTLTARIRRARASGAHVLISLHADATREGVAEGAHVYTLSPEGTDDAARELAERENRSDVIGGIELAGEPDDLAALLVDLAQRGTGPESERLAASVLAEMTGAVTLLPTEPHRRANFRVLKAPEIPSILVELGYLSNPEDRRRITSPDWRERIAAALTRGVARWVRQASPGFVSPKQ